MEPPAGRKDDADAARPAEAASSITERFCGGCSRAPTIYFRAAHTHPPRSPRRWYGTLLAGQAFAMGWYRAMRVVVRQLRSLSWWECRKRRISRRLFSFLVHLLGRTKSWWRRPVGDASTTRLDSLRWTPPTSASHVPSCEETAAAQAHGRSIGRQGVVRLVGHPVPATLVFVHFHRETYAGALRSSGRAADAGSADATSFMKLRSRPPIVVSESRGFCFLLVVDRSCVHGGGKVHGLFRGGRWLFEVEQACSSVPLRRETRAAWVVVPCGLALAAAAAAAAAVAAPCPTQRR